jgi:leucyl-tRNA synthetase
MTAEAYKPEEIELRWQQRWQAASAEERSTKGSRFYLLEMFPYPSGRIHMGHVRNYTIGDVLARYLTAKGYQVLHPMGWDAFGLPAELAAIKHGTPPARWTKNNIDVMRAQLIRMGFSYDWRREIATCAPEYYRWEQLFFIQMLEHDLAYRKSARVNWCDQCGTVLANEQVDGVECWRGHSPVRQRELDQWFLRITRYAEELLQGLDRLQHWPEKVLTMQRNWIGRSPGLEIDFQVVESGHTLTVFTTRADTLYGATFVSMAVEHPLVSALAATSDRKGEVLAFVERIKAQEPSERSQGKDGVFTGYHVVNPINGRKLPLYLANFVLMEYGTGAVMAVPAHDQRDFEFARRYAIPVLQVIEPEDGRSLSMPLQAAFEQDGVLRDSAEFSGLRSEEARTAIARRLTAERHGRQKVHYRLRDWGISRQRYWGAPIPIVYCSACGAVPVRVDQLPVVLPTEVQLLEGGGSPLPVLDAFVRTNCPACGGPAKRETDTMDTFVESSWYFLRYVSPTETKVPFDRDEVRRWLPVSQYIGGVEHAVLHLLYARFVTRVLRDLGWIDLDEPFERLLTQGMVIKDGAKMSKSRGNVVDPDDLIRRYGADTARLFSLFAAPPDKDLEWSDRGVEGAYRFLTRVWRLALSDDDRQCGWDDPGSADLDDQEKKLRAQVHETIGRVTRDVGERMHFNTAVSAIMELVNALYEFRRETPRVESARARAVFDFGVAAALRLLSPFVPHIANELWERRIRLPVLSEVPWPDCDQNALAKESVEIALQINGKVRARVRVSVDLPTEKVVAVALHDPRIVQELAGRTPRKNVVVPNRLVNLVL